MQSGAKSSEQSLRITSNQTKRCENYFARARARSIHTQIDLVTIVSPGAQGKTEIERNTDPLSLIFWARAQRGSAVLTIWRANSEMHCWLVKAAATVGFSVYHCCGFEIQLGSRQTGVH